MFRTPATASLLLIISNGLHERPLITQILWTRSISHFKSTVYRLVDSL